MNHTFRCNIRRLLSLLLALMAAAALVLSSAMPVHADTKQQELEAQKNQAQQELEAIRQQIKTNENNIEAAEAQKELYAREQSAIKVQINALNQQIEDLETQIATKEQEITDKQAEIEQKQQEYDTRWAEYKDQIFAMQTLDQGGAIALLSTARNFYQLLTFDQVLQDVSDANTRACEDLENQGNQLKEEREQLEQAKADLEAQEAELQNQTTQLNGKVDELAANIQAQDSSISAAEAKAQALQEAESEAQAKFNKAADELDSYLRSIIENTKNNYANAPISCSLDFICPLPSYKYISCYYGDGGHKGVDFAAPGGTPIYAVASGVVTVATSHYSYGNYVMVYHGTDDQGNTYATLYAHMNSWPPVSVGQSVTKGQVIGYVGTTGNSTGNHLHLELRVNGARTNPLSYVPH
ncbi:murein hydrolase activator EnvC family protein [Gemmiger sp.]|uniref:murein hydrolase activator EnvC family protein n=1 Tax=Gemmiger sp. TaxID=2049027 RepID=UPI003F07EB61